MHRDGQRRQEKDIRRKIALSLDSGQESRKYGRNGTGFAVLARNCAAFNVLYKRKMETSASGVKAGNIEQACIVLKPDVIGDVTVAKIPTGENI